MKKNTGFQLILTYMSIKKNVKINYVAKFFIKNSKKNMN